MKQLLLLFSCLPVMVNAQNFYISARAGFTGYQGDMKNSAAVFSQLKPMGSLGAQYDLTEKLSARSYISYGSLKGDDKKASPVLQQRNLNFQTRLLDFEIGAQYKIFNLNYRWWTPYISAGIGIFNYNPYTKDVDDNKIFLKPLSTEGQGFIAGSRPYNLTQFSIPFSIGAHYATGEDTRVGIEIGYRKLFTDYLDDVSKAYVNESELLAARGQQAVAYAWRGDEVSGDPYPHAGSLRGNQEYNDGYYYIALTFSIRYWFDKYKQVNGIPGGSREKKVGCPGARMQGY